MNVFLRPITWKAWQFGVLKTALLAMGVLLGTYFADFWRPYLWLVWVAFAVTVLPAMVWGVQSVFGDPQQSSAPRQEETMLPAKP